MSEYLKKRVQSKRYHRRRAHKRIRNRIQGTGERPRLAVYKSLKHTYAQIIDDLEGRTLASASTTESGLKGELKSSGANVDAAQVVGKTLAERARDKGIEAVVFDRGGYIYHGRVKAVAEAAREGGLKF